jgi:hypothetical protein
MLLCILLRVIEEERRGGLAIVDLLTIYKHYLLRLIKDFPKSYRDNSTVAKAA